MVFHKPPPATLRLGLLNNPGGPFGEPLSSDHSPWLHRGALPVARALEVTQQNNNGDDSPWYPRGALPRESTQQNNNGEGSPWYPRGALPDEFTQQNNDSDDSPWYPRGRRALEVMHQNNTSQRRPVSIPNITGLETSDLPPPIAYAASKPEVPQLAQEEIARLLREQEKLDLKHACEKNELQMKITSLAEELQRIADPECLYGSGDSTISDARTVMSNLDSLFCRLCRRRFKTRSGLKKHVLWHTRPFKCTIVGCFMIDGFSTIYDLDRHTKIRHPETTTGSLKIYRCFVRGCRSQGKNFLRFDNFSSHMKRRHGCESKLLKAVADGRLNNGCHYCFGAGNSCDHITLQCRLCDPNCAACEASANSNYIDEYPRSQLYAGTSEQVSRNGETSQEHLGTSVASILPSVSTLLDSIGTDIGTPPKLQEQCSQDYFAYRPLPMHPLTHELLSQRVVDTVSEVALPAQRTSQTSLKVVSRPSPATSIDETEHISNMKSMELCHGSSWSSAPDRLGSQVSPYTDLSQRSPLLSGQIQESMDLAALPGIELDMGQSPQNVAFMKWKMTQKSFLGLDAFYQLMSKHDQAWPDTSFTTSPTDSATKISRDRPESSKNQQSQSPVYHRQSADQAQQTIPLDPAAELALAPSQKIRTMNANTTSPIGVTVGACPSPVSSQHGRNEIFKTIDLDNGVRPVRHKDIRRISSRKRPKTQDYYSKEANKLIDVSVANVSDSGEESEPVKTRRKRSKTARVHGRRHKCAICSKGFTRARTLEEHVLVHQNQRSFTCKLCKVTFTREKDRNRHESRHAGLKPFICKGKLKIGEWGCGRSFARSDGLKAHHYTRKGQKCIEPLLNEQKSREERAEDDMQSAATTSPSSKEERSPLVPEATTPSAQLSSENPRALSGDAVDLIDEKVLRPLLAEPALQDFHFRVKASRHAMFTNSVAFGHLRDVENFLMDLIDATTTSKWRLTYFGRKVVHGISETADLLCEQGKIGPTDQPYTSEYFAALEYRIKNIIENRKGKGSLGPGLAI